MTTPNKPMAPEVNIQEDPTPDPEMAKALALAQVLQSCMVPPQSATPEMSPIHLEAQSNNPLLRFFEDRQTRQLRQDLAAMRNTATKVGQAQIIISQIATDMVAIGLDSESNIQRIIQEYSHSAMPMAAAPYYVQLAHKILMENLPATAERGADLTRSRI